MTRIEAIEQLRKIFSSSSHGRRASLGEDGIYLVYRARYESAAKRVAALVRDADGHVVEVAKHGKMRHVEDHAVTLPWRVVFTIGVDEDTFLQTGKRFGAMVRDKGPRVVMGRVVRS